jgi:hypothetical protein
MKEDHFAPVPRSIAGLSDLSCGMGMGGMKGITLKLPEAAFSKVRGSKSGFTARDRGGFQYG